MWPQDFIILVVLICHLTYFSHGKAWDLLDLFAGKARISKLGARAGYVCAAYDIEHLKPSKSKVSKHSKRAQRPPMDICSDAGFAWLGLCFSLLPMHCMVAGVILQGELWGTVLAFYLSSGSSHMLYTGYP